VFPKFNLNSFWTLQAVCDICAARCPAPPLGLITVAALLPPSWNLRLVNRNAEELTDADFAWAELVMTGGMLPQQDDALAIIEMCRRRGKPVRSAADAMSSPTSTAMRTFVLGEAEGLSTIRRCVVRRAAAGVFSVKFRADVTTSPTPRFDLLKFEHHLMPACSSPGLSVQLRIATSSSSTAGCRGPDQRADARRARRAHRLAIAATWISSTTISSATRRRSSGYCRR
jgi:hypothetical protein